MQIKEYVLLICGFTVLIYECYQITVGIISEGALQIISYPLVGGGSLLLHEGIQLCTRLSSGRVEEKWPLSSSDLLEAISLEDFCERECNMQRG